MKRIYLSFSLCGMLLCGCGQKEQKTATLAPISVRTETVGASEVSNGKSYSGTVEETSGTTLSFSSMGTIKTINISEGQYVSKGQLIATLDETSAQNAYEISLSSKKQADDAYTRMKQLHDAGSISEMKWVEILTQVEQANSQEKIAKKALEDCKLYVPFSGYISEKQAEIGANAMPGTPIVKLVEIDNVKVKISVPESEISTITKGKSTIVSVSALNGKQFNGTVIEKGVTADKISRSYEVKILVDNKQKEILPGMICDVVFTENTGNQVIQLPANIIQIDWDNKPFVWVDDNNKALKKYVEVGESVGESVTIKSGLNSGDKVIVEGQQKVSSGMEIKSI